MKGLLLEPFDHLRIETSSRFGDSCGPLLLYGGHLPLVAGTRKEASNIEKFTVPDGDVTVSAHSLSVDHSLKELRILTHTRSMDSRSTVGMNLEDMCPPNPVV